MSEETDAPQTTSTPTPASAQKQQDNPLTDIIVNVLLPVLILTNCSKDGSRFWHLGPYIAMSLAIAIPLCYGIYHFAKHKKINTFSAVGVANVLLTGLITIYLFSTDDPDAQQDE